MNSSNLLSLFVVIVLVNTCFAASFIEKLNDWENKQRNTRESPLVHLGKYIEARRAYMKRNLCTKMYAMCNRHEECLNNDCASNMISCAKLVEGGHVIPGILLCQPKEVDESIPY